MMRGWTASPRWPPPSSQVAAPKSKAWWQNGTQAPPSPSRPKAQNWASSGCGGRAGWRRGRGCWTGGRCSSGCSGAVPGSSHHPSFSLSGHLTLTSSLQRALTPMLWKADLTEGYGRPNLLKWFSRERESCYISTASSIQDLTPEAPQQK